MKILMFSEEFGGITTTFIRNEIDYLLAEGHIIMYICNEARKINISHAGFSLHVLEFRRDSFWQKIFYKFRYYDIFFYFKNYKFGKQIKEAIYDFSPDIIHCHFFNEALILMDNAKVKSIPLLIHFHGYDASRLLKYKSYKRRIKSISNYSNVHFIFCSENMKSRIERAINRKINGAILLYGIRTDKFIPKEKRPTGQYVFLQIAKLENKKGHLFSLITLNKFLNDKSIEDRKKYKYIIAGDGSLLEKLKITVRDLALENCVEFAGAITPAKAIELLGNADVFLHHSITAEDGDMEGIPNAIMEAMAMELPIVSTWHSGIPELVENGVNGLLVHEKSIDEYISAIKSITGWPIRIKENRQKILQQFSYESHGKQLVGIYQNCKK